MKVWGRRSIGGICVLLAVFGIASSATAKPGYRVVPSSSRFLLALPQSNGYVILVSAKGHHQVELTAFRDGIFASYAVRGRASSHGLWANFGRFGRLRLRFDNKRATTIRLHRNCKGRSGSHQVGILTGTIEFRGEHEFIRVSADRAVAEFERTFRQVCRQRKANSFALKKPEPSLTKQPAAILEAAQRAHGVLTTFNMIELGYGIGSLVVAGTTEQTGRVQVSKATLGGAEPKGLRLSEAGVQPVTARVRLPKPFSGKGFFFEDSESAPTWTGSLGLNVPGLSKIPLVGPNFRSALCVARSTKQFRHCLNEPNLVARSVEKLVFSLAQGSGSHSQPLAEARLSWSR